MTQESIRHVSCISLEEALTCLEDLGMTEEEAGTFLLTRSKLERAKIQHDVLIRLNQEGK